MSKQLVEELYTPNLTATRERIKTDPRLKSLLDDKADPALFEAFLITWNSLGVYMTEPVDGWIRRAGEATVKVGLDDVGQKLIAHAKHEAGHHLMMVEDTKHLVARWNERRSPKLNADELIAQPPTESMKEYREIHENTITGEMPAAQVAIEYEIEGLSTILGPVILEAAKRVCGEEILQGMSFLKEHTEIDVGHTALNEVMLNKLLAQVPDKAPIIAKTGASALDIYLRFMGDCVDRAGKLVQSAAAA